MPFQRRAGQTKRARGLRQMENPAEAALWLALRNRQLGDHKFVRQFPIGPYFADFVCRATKLVIEVDGSQHIDSDQDKRRDRFMTELGYAVMRVPSVYVLQNRSGVCDTILAVVEGRLRENVAAFDLKLIWPSPDLRLRANRPLPQAGEVK